MIARAPRHRLTRRAVLRATGGAVAAPFIARSSQAAEVSWRLGHSAPTDFALHHRLVEAAGEIAAKTNGRMQLQVFSNGELGSPVGLLSQVRSGTVDAAPFTGQLLASNLVLAGLPTVGFAFPGYEAVWAALDNDLGAFIRARINQRLGLVAMDRCWNFGLRQVTTSDQTIRIAQDMKGFRLRTQAEADFIGLFQALNALPVAMPLSDLAQALQTRVISGQEGVLPLIKVARLGRYQTTCALTNHIWDGHWMCVAARAWSGLPDDLKPIVSAALNGAALNQRKDTMDLEAAARHELEAAGMTFNPVDSDSFRAVLRGAGYYASWQKRMGEEAWAALEKHTGRLA